MGCQDTMPYLLDACSLLFWALGKFYNLPEGMMEELKKFRTTSIPAEFHILLE